MIRKMLFFYILFVFTDKKKTSKRFKSLLCCCEANKEIDEGIYMKEKQPLNPLVSCSDSNTKTLEINNSEASDEEERLVVPFETPLEINNLEASDEEERLVVPFETPLEINNLGASDESFKSMFLKYTLVFLTNTLDDKKLLKTLSFETQKHILRYQEKEINVSTNEIINYITQVVYEINNLDCDSSIDIKKAFLIDEKYKLIDENPNVYDTVDFSSLNYILNLVGEKMGIDKDCRNDENYEQLIFTMMKMFYTGSSIYIIKEKS
ncbi:hypothetical protein NGRA_1025 [Nosema granulosis]|uniref:Uncharacterized protein n=1 Tax=Nosema granulosis TaxID=83296 RepID=A0A9P6GZ73_9MICR|nr:hypothetical protein NGRA_1025 [Nosema granulosis]